MGSPTYPLTFLSPSLNPHILLLPNGTPTACPNAIQHLQDPPLLLLAYASQVRVRGFQAADLLFDADGAAVFAADEGADEFAAEAFQVAFQGDEFAVVFDQHAFVGGCLGAHGGEEDFVLFVFAEEGGVGAHDADPHGAEEFAFEAFLRV